MSVKAKFTCISKTPTNGYYGPGENVTFMAATAMGEHDENTSFFNSTPAGSLSLSCVNPKANGEFEVGKEYYLIIEKAE